jgi:hypothetical protein
MAPLPFLSELGFVGVMSLTKSLVCGFSSVKREQISVPFHHGSKDPRTIPPLRS